MSALIPAMEVANAAQSFQPAINAAIGSALGNMGQGAFNYGAGHVKRKLQQMFRRKVNARGMRSREDYTVSRTGRVAKPKAPTAGNNKSSAVYSARSAVAHPVSVKGRARKKAKKSLKDRIVAIEKRNKETPLSHYKFCDVKPYTLSVEGQELMGTEAVRNKQSKIVFDFPCKWNRNTLNTKLGASIPRTDDNNQVPTSAGANFSRFVKRHMKLVLKNTGRTSAEIKYVRYRTKDFTSRSIFQNFNDQIQDKGHLIGTIESGAGPVTGPPAGSYLAPRLIFANADAYEETFGIFSDLDEYKTIGKVGKTLLQPGDFFEIYDSFNGFCKTEERDRIDTTYNPFDTFGILVQVNGVIATDTTATAQVGRADYEVSGLLYDYCSMKFQNDLGHNKVDWDVNGMVDSANGWSTGGPSISNVEDGS